MADSILISVVGWYLTCMPVGLWPWIQRTSNLIIINWIAFGSCATAAIIMFKFINMLYVLVCSELICWVSGFSRRCWVGCPCHRTRQKRKLMPRRLHWLREDKGAGNTMGDWTGENKVSQGRVQFDNSPRIWTGDWRNFFQTCRHGIHAEDSSFSWKERVVGTFVSTTFRNPFVTGAHRWNVPNLPCSRFKVQRSTPVWS